MSNNKLLWRIQNLAKRSMEILKLSNNISIVLEPMGNRFRSLENAAEIGDSVLHVNLDWLRTMDEQGKESEIRLLIYHEIRHVYQHSEISKLKNKQQTEESQMTIARWELEFNQYHRNEGGASTIRYFSQFIEIDAYAFGMYLLNLDVQRGEKLDLETQSIPDEVFPLIINRMKEIAYK